MMRQSMILALSTSDGNMVKRERMRGKHGHDSLQWGHGSHFRESWYLVVV